MTELESSEKCTCRETGMRACPLHKAYAPREAKSSKLQLITRLRSIYDFEHDETEAICEEAAVEIERLTTALQVETICHQVASDSNRAKREEIELLKQQLFEARNDLDRLHDIMRGERAPAPEPRDG